MIKVFQLLVIEHPGIFADKCNAGYDRWKAALSRVLVICQAGW